MVAELDDTIYEGRTLSADDTFDKIVSLGFEVRAQHGSVVALGRPTG